VTDTDPTVFVVDDDASVRHSLARLIRSIGFKVEVFSSAREFLNRNHYDGPGCMVLDVRMPGLSGIQFQEYLADVDYNMPIIFITGYGNISMSVKAMKAGAVDFLLTKPFNDQDLLDAIHKAIKQHTRIRREKVELSEIQQCAEALTLRERDVFVHLVAGMLNKQTAYELGISEKTVKVHRARIMRKMQAESLPDLVRMSEKLKRATPPLKSNL
jgi:RNA polymerase sigma factor (sigma-70 family)